MTEFNQTFIQINGFILIGFPRILDLQSRAILSTVSVAVLACNRVASDIISLSIVLFAYTLVSGLFIFSYTKIIISVLKIASSEGRRKAFSTCASHLVVIAVFILCSLLVSIINRIPRFSIDVRNMVSLVQHMLPPLANPIIYSLRTKEIRDSFKRLLKRSLTAPNSN
nr:PREDICTED: olfactory receptor 11-like [Latimeria chalumnae]|eukprot:XP_014351805.1 PREDICTED: olfactory receptor 11-like [Latimeria chalumnae]